ncbi:unnamed protein product, partial [Prorocentrum cordatum]
MAAFVCAEYAFLAIDEGPSVTLFDPRIAWHKGGAVFTETALGANCRKVPVQSMNSNIGKWQFVKT